MTNRRFDRSFGFSQNLNDKPNKKKEKKQEGNRREEKDEKDNKKTLDRGTIIAMLNFMDGFGSDQHTPSLIQFSDNAYDALHWLITTGQYHLITTSLEKPWVNIFKNISHNNISFEVKHKMQTIDADFDELTKIATESNPYENFRSIMVMIIEAWGRISAIVFQNPQDFTFEDNCSTLNIDQKKDLVAFTNLLLAIFSVSIDLLVMYLVKLCKQQNIKLNQNEPGFPVLFQHYLTSSSELVLENQIASTSSYLRTFFAIFKEPEKNYIVPENEMSQLDMQRQKFIRGAELLKDKQFPISQFEPGVEHAADDNQQYSVEMINRVLQACHIQETSTETRYDAAKVAGMVYNYKNFIEMLDNYFTTLFSLIQTSTSIKIVTHPLGKIEHKVNEVYQKHIFPLAKTLKTKSKADTAQQERQRDLQIEVDSDWILQNLETDISQIIQDYSLSKRMAIVHSVRAGYSNGHVFDLLSRLKRIQARYSKIHFSYNQVRQLFFSIVEAFMVSSIENFWYENHSLFSDKGQLVSEALKNQVLAENLTLDYTLILNELSSWGNAISLSSETVDLLAKVELETAVPLLNYNENRQVNLSWRFEKLVDKSKLPLIFFIKKTISEQESGVLAWGHDLVGYVRSEYGSVLFLGYENSSQLSKGFYDSLSGLASVVTSKPSPARKLISILNKMTELLKANNIDKAISILRYEHSSEIRNFDKDAPFGARRTVVVDIGDIERLILDFESLEKGVLVPLFAASHEGISWY